MLDGTASLCHNARIVRGEAGGTSPLAAQLRAAGLTLDTLDLDAVGDRAEVWERVVRKLRAGMDGPAGPGRSPVCWTNWPGGSRVGSTRRRGAARTRVAPPPCTGPVVGRLRGPALGMQGPRVA